MMNGKPNQTRIILNSTALSQHSSVNQANRIWAMVITTSIISGALFGSLLTTAIHFHNDWHEHNELYDDHTDPLLDAWQDLKFISRIDWIAQPPEEEPIPLQLPSTRLIIAHTVTNNCSTQAACSLIVRTIQAYHVETLRMDDITYNFIIGGNGNIYVGRGWNNQGNHTNGYNEKSICIAFIGTFTKDSPTQQQLYATQKLIKEGVSLNKLSANYHLYGHRQLKSTESPGQQLFNIIKTWEHWSAEIE